MPIIPGGTRWRVVASVFAMALLAPLGSRAGEGQPPPAEEIALRLREARIAGQEGRLDAQRRLLEALALEHPDDSSALLALQELAASLPADAPEAGRAREALRRLLLDPARLAPLSVLEAFALDARSSVEDLDRLAVILGQRSAESTERSGHLLLLAALQERLGRLAEARATMGRLLDLSGDPEVRQRCLHLDIELERWDHALALLETQRRVLGPDKLRLPAALIYSALGRIRELDAEVAALDFDDLLVTRSLLPMLIEIAFVLHDGGHGDRARAWLDRLDERFPEDAILAEIRAAFFRPQGLAAPPPGRPGSEKAPFDLLNEGTALLAAGEAHSAYPILERAVHLLGEHDLAWFNLGLAAADLQRWERAEEAFDRCVQLNPRFVRGLVQRAQARLRLGRISEAAADAARALDLDPRSKSAVLILYHCAKARGDEEAASVLMRRWQTM